MSWWLHLTKEGQNAYFRPWGVTRASIVAALLGLALLCPIPGSGQSQSTSQPAKTDPTQPGKKYGHAWGKGVIAGIYPKDRDGQLAYIETNLRF